MDSNFSLAAKQTLENYDAKVPKEHDRVYKDECLYSFDSPVSIEFAHIFKLCYYIFFCNQKN